MLYNSKHRQLFCEDSKSFTSNRFNRPVFNFFNMLIHNKSVVAHYLTRSVSKDQVNITIDMVVRKLISVKVVQVDDLAEFWFLSTGLHQYA